MRRFGHIDNLELISTPKQRLHFWGAAVLELFGLGALGLTLGTTIVEVLSDASVLRGVLVGLVIAILLVWVRWRSWPRALYGLGIAIIVLTAGAPLLGHFLP